MVAERPGGATPGRGKRLAALAIGTTLLLSSPALAEEDTQAWGAVVANGAVRGDLFVWPRRRSA
ncbi:MAG: hypothetical protein ABIV36_20395 [Sphingobium limneticum]